MNDSKVTPAQIPAPNATSAPEGDYLLSLETEFEQNPAFIKSSALLQALISRRICLTDTQIIESSALEDLFMNNDRELMDEIEQTEQDRPAMFGTCTRKGLGADILAALDLMLEPKPPFDFPAYFTRLSPEKNRSLREEYARLKTTAERRESFFKAAGKRTTLYLNRVGGYFGRHPLAVVSTPAAQQPRLYELVEKKLDSFRAAGNWMKFAPIDHKIFRALEEEINDHRDKNSRERLHLAIYDQELRHFYKGKAEESDDPHAERRLHWRYLINTLYNFDLADRYGSAPVFDAKWYDLPSHLTLPEDQPIVDKNEQVATIELETMVYRDLLTIPFVAEVRRESSFWDSINKMERAQADGDAEAFLSALKDHVQMISACFKRYLERTGQGKHVTAKVAEVMVRPLASVTLASTLAIDAALTLHCHMPPLAVGGLVIAHAKQASSYYFTLKNLVGMSNWTVEEPRFRNFRLDLARAAHAKLPRAESAPESARDSRSGQA